MVSIRVVIADDHPITRQGLAAVMRVTPDLELVGQATNGREAVEAVLRERPDVLVVDLVMPELDGVGTIVEVKRALPEVAIVVLTTFADAALVHRAIRAGAEGYLLKDVEVAELARAIRTVHAGSPYLHPEATRHLLNLTARPPQPAERLTEREQQVLTLVARGLTNRQIGRELEIAEKTVSVHVSNLLGKLELSSRTQAALYATQAGLVPLEP